MRVPIIQLTWEHRIPQHPYNLPARRCSIYPRNGGSWGDGADSLCGNLLADARQLVHGDTYIPGVYLHMYSTSAISLHSHSTTEHRTSRQDGVGGGDANNGNKLSLVTNNSEKKEGEHTVGGKARARIIIISPQPEATSGKGSKNLRNAAKSCLDQEHQGNREEQSDRERDEITNKKNHSSKYKNTQIKCMFSI